MFTQITEHNTFVYHIIHGVGCFYLHNNIIIKIIIYKYVTIFGMLKILHNYTTLIYYYKMILVVFITQYGTYHYAIAYIQK